MKNTAGLSSATVPAYATPSTPRSTSTQLMMSSSLWPKRSTMGPNTSEPAMMPIGSDVTRLVVSPDVRANRPLSHGSTEPRVIIDMPKKHMPMHAAINTAVVLKVLDWFIASCD